MNPEEEQHPDDINVDGDSAQQSDHGEQIPSDDDDQGYDEDEYAYDDDDYSFAEAEDKTACSRAVNQEDEAMWSFYWQYQNQVDYRDTFEPTYYCHSLSKTKNSYPQNSDKVIMPASALDHLLHMKIQYPMMFHIKNSFTGKSSHCGVLEFTAEEGSVLLPDWMMENLGLEDGDLVNMKSARLVKATFLKLQPHKMEFITKAGDPKAVLESTLRSFSCLSSGDTILINAGDRSYYLDVLETKPGDAVSVNETDCEVDFAPPLDYIEEKKMEQRASSEIVKVRRGKVVFGSCRVQDEALCRTRKASEEEKVKDETLIKAEEEKFVPFTGKKYSLLD